METIRGRTPLSLDFKEIRDQMKNYDYTLLDLGTGDGRYVHELAKDRPDWFVVGLDAGRENLRDRSRTKLPNMLFVIASAQQLPCAFEGLFTYVTVNFPWGSLLEGLLACDRGLMHGLKSISRPGTQIEINLNSGALKEAGTSLEAGAGIIHNHLERHGWDLELPHPMNEAALAKFPTTWARRLAHGRDPLAIRLCGRRA